MRVEAGEGVRGQIIQGVRGDGGGEVARWKSSHQTRNSRTLSPYLLAVSSVLLHHAAQGMWAPRLPTPRLPGGEPHLHSVSILVSGLSYSGLSDLCSCCTRVVRVGLRDLSVFVSVKEKYYCLHGSHLS